MEKETHVASPEMKIFFEKLLELKSFVKEHREDWVNSAELSDNQALEEVYIRLDAIIKEKE